MFLFFCKLSKIQITILYFHDRSPFYPKKNSSAILYRKKCGKRNMCTKKYMVYIDFKIFFIYDSVSI